jgi:hypothetical protein
MMLRGRVCPTLVTSPEGQHALAGSVPRFTW